MQTKPLKHIWGECHLAVPCRWPSPIPGAVRFDSRPRRRRGGSSAGVQKCRCCQSLCKGSRWLLWRSFVSLHRELMTAQINKSNRCSQTRCRKVLSLKKAYKGSFNYRFASFTCNRVNQLVVPCTLTAAAKRRRKCRSVFARES